MQDKLVLTLKPERYFISDSENFKKLTKKTTIIENESDGVVYTTSYEHGYSNNEICSINHDTHKGLNVYLTPNKIVGHVVGTAPISFKAWQGSIYKTNETLAEYGIDCDLMESKIYRRDSDFDIITPRPHQQYLPLFAFILPITATRGKNKGYESTRYLESSNTKKIAIYDKATEQGLTGNITRIEPRFLNLTKDKTFATLLLGDVTEPMYNKLRKADKALIQKQIFTIEPQVIKTKYHNFLMECIMNRMNMATALKQVGLMALAKESKKYNIDTLEYLKALSQDRHQRRRFLLELKNCWFVNKDMREVFDEFKELFQKVA